MRQASLWKAALALVLLFVNTVPGCTTRDRETSPAVHETMDAQSGLRVFSADAHDALLKRILADRRVETCRRVLESRGLGSRPVSSFTAEGRNGDGAVATVTVMVFAGPDSAAAGTVAFLESDGRTRVCAGVVSTADGTALSEASPLAVTEYVAGEEGSETLFEAVCADTGGPGDGEGFWNCVGASAVAGTVLCTLKCLPAGPAYAECLIGCTGWAILSAIVGCAFAELVGASD